MKIELAIELNKTIEKLHERIATLEEALKWYADPIHYGSRSIDCSDIKNDFGNRAREALGDEGIEIRCTSYGNFTADAPGLPDPDKRLLLEENEKLREALKYYTKARRIQYSAMGDMFDDTHTIEDDGVIARKALGEE